MIGSNIDMLAALRQARLDAELSPAEIDRAARLKMGTCAGLEDELDNPIKGRLIASDAVFKIAKLLGIRFAISWLPTNEVRKNIKKIKRLR